MGPEIHEQMWGAQVGSFADLYHDLEGGIMPISFFFPYLPFFPPYRKRDAAREKIVKVFAGIIAQRRAAGEDHDDILQVLMNAEYKDGTSLNDDQISGILIGLLFAGQHTSSITTTWTLLFLLYNPNALKKGSPITLVSSASASSFRQSSARKRKIVTT
jgi:sterol 14-demethylase